MDTSLVIARAQRMEDGKGRSNVSSAKDLAICPVIVQLQMTGTHNEGGERNMTVCSTPACLTVVNPTLREVLTRSYKELCWGWHWAQQPVDVIGQRFHTNVQYRSAERGESKHGCSAEVQRRPRPSYQVTRVSRTGFPDRFCLLVIIHRYIYSSFLKLTK